MFQGDLSGQKHLFAFTHRDLLAADSDVWLYIDLFESLDLLDFDARYTSQGQAAKDPRLMLRTIFYALTHGVISGRRLADACRNDNRFIVLSGALKPDRRTFDRFIERHAADLDQLFVDVIHLAQKMELVSLGRVAIDGSKFKANADRSMRYEKMGRAIEHIREELKKLRADLAKANAEESSEIEDKLADELRSKEKRLEKIQRAKAQIEHEYEQSTTKESKKNKRKITSAKALHDVEAKSLGASAKFSFGYNVQAAVDETSQIVLAADIHDCANDSQALLPILDQVKENCGDYPASTLADNGYGSLANIEGVLARKSDPIIALSREGGASAETREEQIWSGISDKEYYCLRGRKIPLACRSENHLIFRKSPGFCIGCPYQKRCHFYGRKSPMVLDDAPRAVMKWYVEQSREEDFKENYRRRKAIVEPVFGNIKNKGIKIFVCGKKKVKTWWKMACTAHNIEKIVGRTKSCS